MTITINVNRISENNDTYFLATSEDVDGFLAESNSLDNIVEISLDVIGKLKSVRNKRLNNQKIFESIAHKTKFVYSI